MSTDKLHEELRHLYASRNITRVTKSRNTRWVGHVAYTEKMRTGYSILVAKRRAETTWEI